MNSDLKIKLKMGFQDLVLLPSRASFAPHLLKVMAEVKASGSSHVLKLWLGVSEVMLTVKQFHFNRDSLCVSKISWRS